MAAITTKHDALTIFIRITIIIWCKISEKKYLNQHVRENDMWFSYSSHSRITIFYDFDSNSNLTRDDSNSDSNSRVYQNPWFRFQFQFQHHVILIPIPIPTNQALSPIIKLTYGFKLIGDLIIWQLEKGFSIVALANSHC